MRRPVAALTAAVAVAPLVACGGSGAHAVTARATGIAPCAPADARIIATDLRAQVYSLNGLVFGCDRRTRRSISLGSATTCIGAARVDHVALADSVAAYGIDHCGVDAGFTVVVVRRLSDGRRVAGYEAVGGTGLVESYQSIGSIVVKGDDSVAWIASERSIIGRESRIEVEKVQRGERVTLDSGPAIVASSLRLRGSTLSWRRVSQTHAETLSSTLS